MHYFFVSEETSGLVSGVVATVQFLDAQEVDFRQSLAMCPVRPQNIQSLLSKWFFYSTAVSLPSFPSLVVRSGLPPELLEVFMALPLDSLVFLGAAEEEEAEAEVDDLLGADLDMEGLADGFVWQLTLDFCFQWCTSTYI